MANPLVLDVEALRTLYRPVNVRLLFIGESAPVGNTFFYAANSHLFYAVRDAFAFAFGDAAPEGGAFLEAFKHRGCFLIDLCPMPVNGLAAAERRRARLEAIPALAAQLYELQAPSVACVMRGIRSLEPVARINRTKG